MKDVACWTIIHNHDPAEVWLHTTEILDVIAATECAMLPIIPANEVFSILLKPVDDGVGVFLHRSGKDDEFVPFADLWSQRTKSQACRSSEGMSSLAEMFNIHLA